MIDDLFDEPPYFHKKPEADYNRMIEWEAEQYALSRGTYDPPLSPKEHRPKKLHLLYDSILLEIKSKVVIKSKSKVKDDSLLYDESKLIKNLTRLEKKKLRKKEKAEKAIRDAEMRRRIKEANAKKKGYSDSYRDYAV